MLRPQNPKFNKILWRLLIGPPLKHADVGQRGLVLTRVFPSRLCDPRSLNFYVSPWHLGTQNFDEVELMLLAFQRSWIFSKDEMVRPMKFYPLIPKRQRPAWDEQPGPSKVSSSNWVAPLIFAKSFSDSIQIRISLVDSLGIHVKVFGFSMSSQLLLASKIPHRLIRQFVSLFTVLYISQVSHEKKKRPHFPLNHGALRFRDAKISGFIFV